MLAGLSRFGSLWLLTAVVPLLLTTAPGRAASDESDPDKPPAQAPGDRLQERSAEPAAASEPGEQPAAEEVIQRAVQGMRAAERRIAERDTGADTRKIQQRVVADLERLIDALKQRRSSAASASSVPMGQQPQQRQPAESKQEPAGGQPQPQGASGAASSAQKARQSSDQPRPPQERDSRLIRGPQDLAKDVWGHLPPRLREQLLNVYQEKYLPKYDELVRRYFESLAEEGRKQRRR